MQNAWFAAPENGGFNAFAGRYRAKYNTDPTRIATLSYDAVSLAAALARSQGSQRYSENVLLNRSGFTGADGVFRFRSDGLNDRGLPCCRSRVRKAVAGQPGAQNLPAVGDVTRRIRVQSRLGRRSERAAQVRRASSFPSPSCALSAASLANGEFGSG